MHEKVDPMRHFFSFFFGWSQLPKSKVGVLYLPFL